MVTLVAGVGAPSALAYNSVQVGSGDSWNVNDAAAPGVDTGSIRSTTSNAMMGYGGIRMDVAKSKNPLNGILLRGFGTTYDGGNTFTSAHPVELDGIAVQRKLVINPGNSYGRFFDTFTNTTQKRQFVDVAFGGQLGYNTGANQSQIAATSTGDQTISHADAWAECRRVALVRPASTGLRQQRSALRGTPKA
ncbi:hypothetical protein [Streptomyces mirabilis]|uniref:hypothetical protein n=1 Tax=Streptomyces mirabilis TaxID=68239 RepID=UPI00331E6149